MYLNPKGLLSAILESTAYGIVSEHFWTARVGDGDDDIFPGFLFALMRLRGFFANCTYCALERGNSMQGWRWEGGIASGWLERSCREA